MVKGKANPFQKLLEKERLRLVAEVNRLAQRDAVDDNLGYGNHMADDATEAFEQAQGASLRQHMEELLAEVDDALERIQRGTFGKCESCGTEIDKERLQVLPYARFCIECQQKKKQT